MSQTTRQTNLLVEQDWTKIYQSFTNADFTSYDFQTLRNSMINYIKTYYPETFNDFLESSEYLALIDMVAFLGQSLAFRTDLNARENFIDTAQRRDSILKLARMLSYNPTRTVSASGLLKFDSISTTETIYDSNGNNLSNATVFWNDLTNDNWLEQFTTILNASMISSQAIGKPGNSQSINGIATDEYTINLNTNTLPIGRFATNLNGTVVNFEAVSATSLGESYIYERDPILAGQFNILYRNDNNGNGSSNTGYFLYFKQGSLSTSTFNITNAIPNNFVSIPATNVNNSDHWLYSLDVNNTPQIVWTAVPALAGTNVVYNNLQNKNVYQINTTNNDGVNLVFGDGSFANIPQGNFIFYYRTANGLSYTLTPDDLSSVTVAFPYVGKRGSAETLRITASLKYTVTNAAAAQSLASIKTYAPQQYYTQNRMITGEDYNIFPLTTFTSIQKIKAVNRTSSGISNYLDTLDATGTFSTTNTFADDGTLSSTLSNSSFTFDFLTTTDIYSTLYNNIIPLITSTGMTNYYYANYGRNDSPYANVTFVQSSSSTTTSSGNLTYPSVSNVLQVGTGITSNLKYVAPGASLLFSAPSGSHFDSEHNLLPGVVANVGDSYSFYATVTNVVSANDPATPNQVTFGTVVPTGALLSSPTAGPGKNCIIPAYMNSFSTDLVTTIVNQILTEVNFGITYDQANQTWKNISSAAIATDDSWMMKFTFNAGIYNVQYRNLVYSFSSAGSTVFYFDPTVRVYNSQIGEAINDIIKILKINPTPGPGAQPPLESDVVWQVYDVAKSADGYIDNTQLLVRFPTTQMENVPDNPDLFVTVTGTTTARSDLYFQWKHNVPSRSRIDPTPINIIDLYVLTSEYATNYINWLQDLTGTIIEPIAPTSSSLELAYSDLDKYKAISDTLVYNPAKFKPLFGGKADASVQARFQVVKNPNISITDNEIKSQVISAINRFFAITNWDFGDTFYFSELAAYLHTQLVPNISSVLIVPANTNLPFGNYFQINAEPWEIITSAATVNDVDIISAVTAAQLNLATTLVGTY
jgi:hypothetical protein